MADYEQFHPKTRKAWRHWLEQNHASSPGVWMVYYRSSSGKPRIEYGAAVEEALCFGWIDSTARRLDEDRSMQRFTPRKPKSAWSTINKRRVANLIKDGLMTNAGLEKIKLAKKNGSWNALRETEQQASSNSLPDDLLTALNKNKTALNNFRAFTEGYRKIFLYWIHRAKRDKTREARIKQTVLMAAANKKPGAAGFKL